MLGCYMLLGLKNLDPEKNYVAKDVDLYENIDELCVQTWCALDFPLAEVWDARLERTGSIAEGAPRCDFRWHRGGKATR